MVKFEDLIKKQPSKSSSSSKSFKDYLRPSVKKDIEETEKRTSKFISRGSSGGSGGTSRSRASSGGTSRAPQKSSIPKKQEFASGTYNPQTKTFIDKTGKKYSTVQPKQLNKQLEKETFSKKGGKTNLRDYFKPSIFGETIKTQKSSTLDGRTIIETTRTRKTPFAEDRKKMLGGTDLLSQENIERARRKFKEDKKRIQKTNTKARQDFPSIFKIDTKKQEVKDFEKQIRKADTSNFVSQEFTRTVRKTPIDPVTRTLLGSSLIGAGAVGTLFSPAGGRLMLGTGLPLGGKELIKAGQQATGQKVLSLAEEQDIIKKARAEFDKEVNKTGTVGSVVQEIVPAFNYAPEARKAYRKGAVQELIKKGYSKKQAREIATGLEAKNLLAGGGLELGGLITASAGTEMLGQKGFRYFTQKELAKQGLKLQGGSILKQIGGKTVSGALTKKEAGRVVTLGALKGIAPAGVAEGSVFEVIQSFSRGRNVSPERLAVAGAIGGVSAGVLGAGVARFAVTRPLTGSALRKVLYLIDPTEKPGDILGSRALRKQGVGDLSIPIVSNTFVPTGTATQTQTKTQQKGKGKKSSGSTKTFVKTDSKVLSGIFNNLGSIYTQTQQQTPQETPEKTNGIFNNPFSIYTQTQQQIQQQTQQDTQQETQQETQQQTLTQTQTPVNVNIPAFTAPQGGFPLLFGGFGGTKRTGGRRKKLTYYNELKKALRGSMFG